MDQIPPSMSKPLVPKSSLATSIENVKSESYIAHHSKIKFSLKFSVWIEVQNYNAKNYNIINQRALQVFDQRMKL
jgi:hypothetical protein